MTDETFISEKTGKRYKVCRDYSVGGYICIQEIIEPKLEENDWYLDKEDCVWIWANTIGDWAMKDGNEILEVRKANKEHWKRINNEWVKL